VPLPPLRVAQLVIRGIDLRHAAIRVTLDTGIATRHVRMMLAGEAAPGRLDGI
jgi:hypothetical protein